MPSSTVSVARDPLPPSRLDASSIYRRVTVKPAMCGPHSTFIAQAGDWTWDAVSALCGVDAFKARSAEGTPVYLSFYYFHVRASPLLHTGNLEFGDRLDVVSSAFDFGSESILTLHRIRRASSAAASPEPVTHEEFYEHPAPENLYVETFNRWISRRRSRSNADLVRSSPAGFVSSHLPSLPDRYSPRRTYTEARHRRAFRDPDRDRPARRRGFRFTHRVDVTRDLNGAGLLYFASYFAYIDRACLAVWQALGRSEASFVERIILDEKVCYLANADADAEIVVDVEHWSCPGGEEMIDVVLQEARRDVTIAIASVRVLHVD